MQFELTSDILYLYEDLQVFWLQESTTQEITVGKCNDLDALSSTFY